VKPIRDLARHTLIYGSGNVAVSLLSFALIPVYTRYLEPAEYGILGLFLLLHALLTRLYDLGLTNSVGRFFFEYRDAADGRRLGKMVATSQLFLFAWGGVLSIALYSQASRVAELLTGDAAQAPLARVLAFTLLLEALAIPALTLLRVEERAKTWVAITVLRVLGNLGLNIWFVVFAGLGARGILLSSALTAGAVVVTTVLPRLLRTRLAFRTNVLGEMLRFGLPFLPVLIGVWVIDFSDRYLLERFRSLEEVGLYSLGYKFGQAMLIAVSAFSMGWTPLRYRIYEQPDAGEIYARVATLTAVVFATLVVGLSMFADEVVRVATTPAYYGAARVVPLITIAYALYGFHLITSTGMGVRKRTGGLMIVVTAAALLNLGGNLLLIPRYGMMAAAGTTVIANALMVAGTFWFSQRHYPLTLEWGRILLVVGAALAVIGVDQTFPRTSLVASLAQGVLLFAIFLAAVAATGAVDADDARAVRRWIGEVTGREA